MSTFFNRNNDELELNTRYDASVDATFSALLRNVYMWMSMALIITAFTSMYVANSEYAINLLFSNSKTILILVLVQLGLAMGLTFCLNKISFLLASTLFALYSVVTGITLSSIFLVYTGESIVSTFFITAGTFAAMSLFGYFTQKDLSKMGQILIMGIIGIVLASVVNICMHSSRITWITTYVGVVIFVGLTAYDTQRIKNLLAEYSSQGINDSNLKLALMGSFMLYLDFINLFIKLLRILGKKE